MTGARKASVDSIGRDLRSSWRRNISKNILLDTHLEWEKQLEISERMK